MYKLIAFKAVDYPERCELFIEGHRQVLESIGVKKVTSANNSWAQNPDVIVVIVESSEDGQIYGGARIHKANEISPLPMVEAIQDLDSSIRDVIAKDLDAGTGEVCGLWNSRKITGLGIGAIFMVKACLALAPKIGLNSLYALFAPTTVKLGLEIGYEVLSEVGNNGTFYYPKLDLIATAMKLHDVVNLPMTAEEHREPIFRIRNNRSLIIEEVYRNRHVTLEYTSFLE
ncbi:MULTISPECIES: hypothetical protein [Algoriphagus]|jgi:hypothetical protein|uniref:N-acetyltransferase domain-containing protein n=1 Tax=Algoriphagus zhangzhouensis TaxID=1073327 RepID=A0A1M7ZGZ0_9BACT|nr:MULTISPECIES: hypothetical protein [Algoriphagus]TDY44070.1 hypothetical protein A8938_3277 [Algoriphagus zhangzhouensis]SHO64175.1 hypothetical protein SAMN04488108_3273 [Algoriphagus zhangzhouensis]